MAVLTLVSVERGQAAERIFDGEEIVLWVSADLRRAITVHETFAIVVVGWAGNVFLQVSVLVQGQDMKICNDGGDGGECEGENGKERLHSGFRKFVVVTSMIAEVRI
jgi:hypothetical protein